MILNFVVLLLCGLSIVAADLTDDFTKDGIVPDALDHAPKELLTVILIKQ